MFNLFKKKQSVGLPEVLQISREAFEAGLEAGISMVRIAANRDDCEKLHHVADKMQATLDEFREKSNG